MSGGVSFWPPASGSGSTGVTSLNSETGAINLVAGTNITITPSGQTIIIDAASPVAGNLTDAGTDGITITGGSGAVLGAGTSIAQHVADVSHNGYLSSTDWATFNGKQAAGNYITALTGDISASGPGSASATLATVNSNVGSFGSATQVCALTVNAKGLVTAASNTSIQIAESQVTNLVSDLAGKQATGNYITALTGDGSASGPGSAALTLATVNSNVGSFGGATSVSAITVNAKGLVTAAASTAIQIAESQVTNLVSDLSGKQATGNYITALTGDISASGPGSAAATLATVNSNVGSFTNASITVNAKGLVTAASSGAGGGFTQSGLYHGAFNNGTGANYWSRASSTLGAFSLTSTAFSLTDIYKYGFVTVTAKASNVPGITYTAPATGTVKVTVYAAFQPPTSQVADLQLVDGSATAISARQSFSPGSGNPYSNMTLSGFMNVTSASSYSVEIYGATGNGATGFLNGGVNGVYGLNFMLEYVK